MSNLPSFIGTGIAVLSFILNIAIMIGGWYAYTKITGNHLNHLTEDVKNLIAKFETVEKQVIGLIARCEERHSKKD